MRGSAVALVGILAILSTAQSQAADYSTDQLTSSTLGATSQYALFPATTNSFLQPIATGTPKSAVVDTPAGQLIQGDVSSFPFLATLPDPGQSIFLLTLKPCGILNVHSHPDASEQYLVISGVMTGGIAQEVGGVQNTTFKTFPGQAMLVPRGLWHYNQNSNACGSTVMAVFYNNRDPGTVALNPALSGLSAANPTAAAAGNFTMSAGSMGPFVLDPTCLKTCGYPSTGAPNYQSGLSSDIQTFLGLAASPSAGGPSSG